MRLYRLYHFVMLCLAFEFLSCTDLGGLLDTVFLAELLHAHSVSDVRPSTANYNALSYYASIPSYTVNRITRNPIQE